MDISQIRERRANLAFEIAKRIQSFEKATDVQVETISFRRIENDIGETEIIDVEVRINLK